MSAPYRAGMTVVEGFVFRGGRFTFIALFHFSLKGLL